MRKLKFNIKVIMLLMLCLDLTLIIDNIGISNNKINCIKEEALIREPYLGGENYLGILEIPKINLNRQFFGLSSKENNVDKNIQMIETSKMPNIPNSNLILAAHSGNSKIAYFKKLDELYIKDIAYIYFNNIKYKYELEKMYSVKKTGKVLIKTNVNETNLILITCDKKNATLQNVYIFKLIN